MLRSSFAPDVEARPRDGAAAARSLEGACGAWVPDLPTPEPHGAVDVREVLGSIGRGFEENGDALALAAYCEWLGAAAGDRDEAAAAFARAAGALPRVDALDAGRESRRHWRPLRIEEALDEGLRGRLRRRSHELLAQELALDVVVDGHGPR